MIAGDQAHCRAALVNDVKFWADEMVQQGWGPCPMYTLDPNTCKCDRQVEEGVMNGAVGGRRAIGNGLQGW
jgi:hypothetical protein